MRGWSGNQRILKWSLPRTIEPGGKLVQLVSQFSYISRRNSKEHSRSISSWKLASKWWIGAASEEDMIELKDFDRLKWRIWNWKQGIKKQVWGFQKVDDERQNLLVRSQKRRNAKILSIYFKIWNLGTISKRISNDNEVWNSKFLFLLFWGNICEYFSRNTWQRCEHSTWQKSHQEL